MGQIKTLDLLKQTNNNTKLKWMGAIQVQVASTFFYVSVVNTLLLGFTFWYTAGYRVQRYVPWANVWVFLGVAVVFFIVVMFVDYKYILPARQSFQNDQACKHNNPWMDEIMLMKKDIAEIKRAVEK